MKNLLTTKGRIPRLTFWTFVLCLYGFCFVIGTLLEMKSVPEWAKCILGFLAFPVLAMSIIVQIKRWHDRNKSGWWVFINVIPIIGFFWTLFECGFSRGTEGPNQFGPDPLMLPEEAK